MSKLKITNNQLSIKNKNNFQDEKENDDIRILSILDIKDLSLFQSSKIINIFLP